MTTHRSLRHLAERLAGRGFIVLRFDYGGTGDSAGDDRDPQRWDEWVTSSRDAADALRAAGCGAVCLIGLRLGAMIAAAAASSRTDVAGLVGIAPIANGRLFLREAKALVGAMGRPEAPDGLRHPEGVLESAGMILDPASQGAITSFAYAEGSVPASVLVIDRDDRPPQRDLAERFRARGAAVTEQVLPGFVEMTLDPHDAVVPGAILSRVESWCVETLAEAGGTAGETARDEAHAFRRETRAIPGVRESLEFLDADSRLFGVVSLPEGARPTRAMLLLNSGANHRIANGRLYTRLARRLAARGWLALRFDVSGIGDSQPHPGAPENDVYSRHAIDDLRAAIGFLRTRYGITDVETLGICSGAYHGFKGAVAGLPLSGVFVVNPLVFFWKPGMSLAYPPFEMVQAAAQYRQSARDPRKWLKVLQGKVDVAAATRVAAHRALARLHAAAREAARTARLPVEDDLAAELRAAAGRGVAIRFVFSVGDPGEALLTEGAGRAAKSLTATGAMTLDHLALCDHSLSVSWMHERLWQVLERRLPA